MSFKIAVIGAVNVDICGKPTKKYVPFDSNPGHITHSIGGVGFNIARNLALLGCEVYFIAALGGDRYLEEIQSEAEKYGISLEQCLFEESRPNSTYLFITDENGDMLSAVNDMEITELIDADFLKSRLSFINTLDAVVADTNLSAETVKYICENASVPIFADAVSACKARKILPNLGKLQMFKPNKIEAQELTGIEINDAGDAQKAAEKLLSTGLTSVFITLAQDGVLASDGKSTFYHKPFCKNIVNTSGAGDAFFACALYGTLSGLSLEECAVLGLKGSKAACEIPQSLNQNIKTIVFGGKQNEQIS